MSRPRLDSLAVACMRALEERGGWPELLRLAREIQAMGDLSARDRRELDAVIADLEAKVVAQGRPC